jgi:hypothetical protein
MCYSTHTGRVPCPHQIAVFPSSRPRPFTANLATVTHFIGAARTATTTLKVNRLHLATYKSHRPKGGFLQVAVSEAPVEDNASLNSPDAGAPDTALRLMEANRASRSTKLPS